jgi:hypothetical protein
MRRQWMIRCLLVGATPWCADELTLELFESLAGRDLSRYRFYDGRSGVATSSAPEIQPVVYARRNEALVLVANLDGVRPQSARLCLDVSRLGLAGARSYQVELDGRSKTVSPDSLSGKGVLVRMPPSGVRCLTLRVKRE